MFQWYDSDEKGKLSSRDLGSDGLEKVLDGLEGFGLGGDCFGVL